jgi:hypothetical protein
MTVLIDSNVSSRVSLRIVEVHAPQHTEAVQATRTGGDSCEAELRSECVPKRSLGTRGKLLLVGNLPIKSD